MAVEYRNMSVCAENLTIGVRNTAAQHHCESTRSG